MVDHVPCNDRAKLDVYSRDNGQVVVKMGATVFYIPVSIEKRLNFIEDFVKSIRRDHAARTPDS